MIRTQFSRFNFLFLSISLFVIPATAEEIVINLSEFEADFISNNLDGSYVYLGKDLSNIIDVVSRISELDGDQNSPLWELKRHINEGFFLADYDAVIEALANAEAVLQKNYKQLDVATAQALADSLDELIDEVANHALTANSRNLKTIDDASMVRSCGNHCGKRRDLVINENIKVCGKAVFKKDVKFKKDVTIKGTLSAADAIIGSLSVTDLTVASCMDSLCVENLSVVDLAVSGTLSANDAVIENATIVNLTVTATILDSIVGELSVTGTASINDAVITDLTVVNCMTSLCVNDLSIVDISITGFLSLNDAFIDDLSVTDATIITLSADDAVIDDLTVTNCMTSLCVNDLSIVDISITGFLSLNDAFIDDLSVTDATIITLSADDAVIDDLTVTNCMTSLCVNNLSIVDISITGFLSLNDAFIDDLSVTDATIITLSADDAVIDDLTVTNCMTSLCVNSLSVVDLAVSDTLSIEDTVVNGTLTIPALTPAGVVHNSAAGLLSSSLIVNADVDPAAAIVDTKLATISTAGKVANSATTGTNLNTPNTLVLRDGTGSFAAEVVSVVDTVASGNLVLTITPSSTTAGNILKGASTFIHNAGTNNVFVGIDAGNLTVTGANNVGVGINALTVHTTGARNTAVGSAALSSNTIGSFNTAIGGLSLVSNVTTSGNVAVGYRTLQINVEEQNVAVGFQAMALNTTGGANTALGYRSMEANTTGMENTACGQNTLISNISGNQNVAIGTHAMESNLTGSSNIGIGFDALGSLVSGSQNVSCGNVSLANITTGTNNIAVGFHAGENATLGDSNNIYIGNTGLAAESDTIRVGTAGTQTTCFVAGIRGVATGVADAIAVLIDSTGQLGTVSSSKDVKHDIEDMDDQSADVLKLRPVTFVYNGDASEKKQYGLIAEEVDEIFPDIVVRNQEGNPETIQYHILPALLLNEMKKQHATIEQMNNVIARLQEQVEEFIGRVKNLENKA